MFEENNLENKYKFWCEVSQRIVTFLTPLSVATFFWQFRYLPSLYYWWFFGHLQKCCCERFGKHLHAFELYGKVCISKNCDCKTKSKSNQDKYANHLYGRSKARWNGETYAKAKFATCSNCETGRGFITILLSKCGKCYQLLGGLRTTKKNRQVSEMYST